MYMYVCAVDDFSKTFCVSWHKLPKNFSIRQSFPSLSRGQKVDEFKLTELELETAAVVLELLLVNQRPPVTKHINFQSGQIATNECIVYTSIPVTKTHRPNATIALMSTVV